MQYPRFRVQGLGFGVRGVGLRKNGIQCVLGIYMEITTFLHALLSRGKFRFSAACRSEEGDSRLHSKDESSFDYELESKLRKVGVIWGHYIGSTTRLIIHRDTRSLDYSSYGGGRESCMTLST